ncbi:MAG: cation transporter [Parasporobacterium sp.]|nr:cation transporter [Parasporobacterium sp.]
MEQEMKKRDAIIVRTSMIGILANLLLAAFKAVIGLFSNSIAVILDAVNNLSDALSSVITIIGTKLAGRQPDKKHPLGHGRIEYLSAMIVAALVLYAGITALVESVKKIIHPEKPDYSIVSLIIIASAVVVKLLLGRFVRSQGEKVNSSALIASGSDASFDAILSASVLLSAIIFVLTGFSLEAFVGVAIALFIIKAGIEMLKDTLDDLLGKRADPDFVKAIKETVCEDDSVLGAYDLFLHSYGPEKTIASIHVEVPDNMTAGDIDDMARRITQRVFTRHGVIMAGVGIYAINTTDPKVVEMRERINSVIMAHDGILQTHGFHVDIEEKCIQMDVIVDYALENRQEIFAHIREEIQGMYPDFKVMMVMDIDV